MTLLEKHKEDLLALAAGTLPETKQQQTQKLIQADADCRHYWESLSKTTQSLERDSSVAEKNLPLGFHTKLLNRLNNTAGSSDRSLTTLLSPIVRPLSVATTILLLAAGIRSMILIDSPKQERTTHSSAASKPTRVIEANSWAALRMTSTEPSSLLASTTTEPPSEDCPSMGWVARDRWIEQFDL